MRRAALLAVALWLASLAPAGSQQVSSTGRSESLPNIVADFGAPTDGTTDALAAFQRAAAAGGRVIVPPISFRLSGTLTLNGAVTFQGNSYFGNVQAGTKLVCDLAVTPCVTIDGGVGNQPSGLVDILVTRAAGTVPDSSQGIRVTGAYNVVLDNVGSYRSADCWYFHSDGTTGLGYHVKNLFTGACKTNHVVADSIPELYVLGGRLGMNGLGDLSPTSYIKITGGSDTPNAGMGPNTIIFDGVQFNQGQNTVSYWLDFVSVLGAGVNADIFRFSNSYVEAVSTAMIHSDATTAKIYKLGLANMTLNNPSAAVWGLNAATQPIGIEIAASDFTCADFTLAPTAAMDITVAASHINCNTSLTGATGAIAHLTGTTFTGNLTVAGAWNLFDCATCAFNSGSVTNTATGPVIAPGAWKAWTPSMACGSGTITTQTNTGKFRWLDTKTVAFDAVLTQTNAGSCATSLFSSLPTASAQSNTTIVGRETAATGSIIAGYIANTSMLLTDYQNVAPIATGRSITIGGTYEVNAP